MSGGGGFVGIGGWGELFSIVVGDDVKEGGHMIGAHTLQVLVIEKLPLLCYIFDIYVSNCERKRRWR